MNTKNNSFQDLLTIGRNQLLEGLKQYKNKSNSTFFNFTGCEDCFFDVSNRPFFNHIYFLNYFVFTAHSSVYSWNPSKLHGLCIAFYIPIKLLTSLQEECKKNNYIITICGEGYKKDQLMLTNSRMINDTNDNNKEEQIIYDFRNLLPEVELVDINDSNPENKNLYYNLFKWFHTNSYLKSEQKQLTNEINKELLKFDWMYDNFEEDFYNLLNSSLKCNFSSYLEVLDQFKMFKKEDVEIVETGLLVRRELIELLIRKEFFNSQQFITLLTNCGYRVVDVRKFINGFKEKSDHPINNEKYSTYDLIAVYNDGISFNNPELNKEHFYQKVYQTLTEVIIKE
jgi:hypothetical protein